MVCDARSGVRWFLSMCGECDDTCVECDDTCGVRRSFSSALFFEYACLERPIETAKNSTSNPSPNLDRHISFFCILFHTMQNFTGQTILCTLSWNKVTYQNPGQEYDENLVCEDFLNMGMLPLDTPIAIDGYCNADDWQCAYPGNCGFTVSVPAILGTIPEISTVEWKTSCQYLYASTHRWLMDADRWLASDSWCQLQIQ